MCKRWSAFLATIGAWVLLAFASPGLAQSQKAETELERLQKINKELENTLSKLQGQLLEQTKLANQLRDKVVAAEIEAKSLRARLEQMTAKVAEIEKDLARLRAQPGGEPARPVRNPPRELIEGLVKQVEEKSGLITVNVGADAGLQKGQTLEIFRLDADPGKSLYLGSLRILEVRDKEAIAMPVGRPRAPIRVGDRVASRIPGAP
jgi:hypothetical protein